MGVRPTLAGSTGDILAALYAHFGPIVGLGAWLGRQPDRQERKIRKYLEAHPQLQVWREPDTFGSRPRFPEWGVPALFVATSSVRNAREVIAGMTSFGGPQGACSFRC